MKNAAENVVMAVSGFAVLVVAVGVSILWIWLGVALIQLGSPVTLLLGVILIALWVVVSCAAVMEVWDL